MVEWVVWETVDKWKAASPKFLPERISQALPFWIVFGIETVLTLAVMADLEEGCSVGALGVILCGDDLRVRHSGIPLHLNGVERNPISSCSSTAAVGPAISNRMSQTRKPRKLTVPSVCRANTSC